MPATKNAPELLDRPHAAAYLGIQPQTLAAWAVSGRYGLRMVKVGRLVKYRLADLDEFLESRTVTHGGELATAAEKVSA